MEELNLKRLEKIAESLLFAAGEPVSLDSIARVLGQNPSTARKIVSQLKDYYDREERGMQILEIENSYQMTSRPDYYTHIKLLYRSGQKITLTETQLETLAIIAYRQPVTKQEVEEIRGVRSDNIINRLIEKCGGEAVYFLGKPEYFKTIYVVSGVWQNVGWNSIIYLAALTAIDPMLHEAATIDGASRLQRLVHINLPGILPTAVVLLIMNCGSLMSVGFEKVYLLMNDLNRSSAEIISTYVYQRGLIDQDYSYASAVGLFNSVVNLVLLVLVNTISRRISETSLW